ncbi:hypothetical protein CM19_08015 [Candidatus Acidianus copahuensis]|uniref:Uncharacterized protein n=1 Tax=Candidatus Acidianus copahuensis TaxID=1160895 RepID=A0A031LN34_9CREN|nr:hypothetical protein [Candidatus Acidianus copahuensis]EZQ04906.1 hypothetical protein CM19_08015 [Candidatus Acidianus copahuensis]
MSVKPKPLDQVAKELYLSGEKELVSYLLSSLTLLREDLRQLGDEAIISALAVMESRLNMKQRGIKYFEDVLNSAIFLGDSIEKYFSAGEMFSTQRQDEVEPK